MAMPSHSATTVDIEKRRQPWYLQLWIQVLIGMAAAIILGLVSPAKALAMKPLGDAFIRLISMIITLIIFCTVVSGIAGMENLKKVGRVGGMALIYFEVVSTLALLIGLVVGNVTHPGTGFNVNPAKLDAKAIADYAGQAKSQNVTDFLMHIIPSTIVDAFAKGDTLEVLLVSVLFGFALAAVGERGRPLLALFDALAQLVFGVVNILMKFCPHRRLWSDGIYDRKVWDCLTRSTGKADRHVLADVSAVCDCRTWLDFSPGWIRDLPFSCFHKRRDTAGASHQFLRDSHANIDEEIGAIGLLTFTCWASCANGIHVQY